MSKMCKNTASTCVRPFAIAVQLLAPVTSRVLHLPWKSLTLYKEQMSDPLNCLNTREEHRKPKRLPISSYRKGDECESEHWICVLVDAVTQEEVESLYRRFCDLDRRRKGYISKGDLEMIPELAINPIGKRVTRRFQNVNFKDFCRLLSAFSQRASRETRIQLIFSTHDIDSDGFISRGDLHPALRELGGSSLSEEQIEALTSLILPDQPLRGLDFPTFASYFNEQDEPSLRLEIPQRDE